MARRTRLSAIILIYLIMLSPALLPGQDSSRIPEDPLNWLQVTNGPQLGGLDPVMVVFFQVPDDHVGPIYFGIRDPEGDNNSPDYSSGTTTDTRYYLFGGDGCYTDAAARAVDYGDETSASGHLTAGSQLAQLWYNYAGNETGPETGVNVTADNTWVYFPPVSADEGEHVGNFYYFRIVIDGQNATDDIKNAFQLIASGGNSAAPADIDTIKPFAYSWCVDFQRVLGNTWHFYPFVPESAALTDELDIFIHDSDAAGPYSLYDLTNNLIDNSSEPYVALEDFLWSSDTNGDGVTGTFYPFETGGVDQRNGTWHIAYPTAGGGLDENTVEIFAQNSVTNENLPIYSQFYQPAQADHVTVSHDVTETGALRTVTLQLVDAYNKAVPYIRNIYINNPSGTLRILDESGAVIGGVTTGDSYTITTNSSGYVTFTCSNTVDETVTLSFVTDGITTDGSTVSSRLPASGAYGINETIDVTHESGNRPTLVSNGVGITEGNVAAGIDFTVTDIDGAYITAGNNISIRIPDSVNAVFNNAITTPGLVMNGGGAASGAVAATVTYSGDFKTVYIDVTNPFIAGEYIDITGLAFTAANTASLGDFQLSFSGQSGPYNVDDSLTGGNDIVITGDAYFVWDGVGGAAGDLTDDANWVGGTAPTLTAGTSSKVILTSAGSTPQLNADYFFKELRIEAGAVPIASGTTTIDVSGTFQNSGTLNINGTATDISFSGNAFSGSPSLGDVILDDTGTGTLNYANFDNLIVNTGTWGFPNSNYNIYGDLTLENGVTVTHLAFRFFYLYGDLTNNGATITNNLVVFFAGNDQATISGATTFYQLICTEAGKQLFFDTANNQTVTNLLRFTGTSSSPVYLRGSSAGTWTIDNAASTIDISYIDADYAEALTADISCDYSTIGVNCLTDGPGGIPEWTTSGTVYTWVGGSGTGVGTAANWLPATGPPGAGDSVIIGAGSPDDPLLTGNWNLGTGNVTISSGGTLDTDTFTVTCDDFAIEAGGVLDLTGATGGTITSTTLTNDGEIRAQSDSSAPTAAIGTSGTVRYAGSGAALPLGNSYYNLIFDGAAWTAGAALGVNNDLTVAAGSFDTSGNVLTLTGDIFITGGALDIDSAFTLNGDLLNTAGTFTATGNTVTIAGGTHQIYGSNSWNNFDCPAGSAGAVIRIEDGTTQTVGGTFNVAGATGNLTTLTGTGSGGWNLGVTGGGGSVTVAYADISYSTASAAPPYEAYNSQSTNNGNVDWYIFSGATAVFTWEGDVDTLWSTPGNWDAGQVPIGTADVIIPDVAPNDFPVLDGNVTVDTLAIQTDASLTTGSGANWYDLILGTPASFSNEGTLIVSGTETLTLTMDNDSGLVQYVDGGADGTLHYSGGVFDYNDLEIDGAVRNYALAGATTIRNNLTITAGTLTAAANDLAVGGDFDNQADYTSTTGDIAVTGDSVLAGTITSSGAANHAFNGGLSTLTGTVTTVGGTIDATCTANLTLTGLLDAGTGTVTINAGAFEIHGVAAAGTDIQADTIDLNTTSTWIGATNPVETASAGVCDLQLPPGDRTIRISHAGDVTANFGADHTSLLPLEIIATGALNLPANRNISTATTDITLQGGTLVMAAGTGQLITTTGNISLTATGGGLTLEHDLVTDGLAGNVTLSADGAITHTQPITANALTADNLSTTGADIILDSAVNSVLSIDIQSVDGNIIYEDADGFSVTAASTTGNVNLTGGGAINQTGAMAASVLSVITELNGGADINLGLANNAAFVNLQTMDTAGTLADSGNVTFADTNGFTLNGLVTSGNTSLTSGATLTLATAPSLGGDLTIATVDLIDGANDVTLGGAASLTVSSGTPTAQTNTWIFNGGIAQTLTTNGFALNNLSVQNTAGGFSTTDALSLDGSLVVNGAGGMTAGGNVAITGNLTLTAGDMDIDGFDLSCNVFSNATNLSMDGGQTIAFTTPDTDSGRITFDGAGGDMSGLTAFFDLTLSGGVDRTMPATLTVNGELDASGVTVNQTSLPNVIFGDTAGDYVPPTADATYLRFSNLTINGTRTLTPQGDMYIAGNWNNSLGGTFTHGGHLVELITNAGCIISGNTTFFDLRCDLDTLAISKTLTFADSSVTTVAGTLFIRGDSVTNLVTMTSPTAAGWTLTLTGAAGSETVEYTGIRWGQVGAASNNITADNSVDIGLTCDITPPGWIFTPKTVTWDGDTNADWSTGGNWDWGYEPNITDNVIIPDLNGAGGTFTPVLDQDVTVNNLTIQDDGLAPLLSGMLTTGDFDLTVNGTYAMDADASLYRTGFPTCDVNVTSTASGRVVYVAGTDSQIQEYGATDYNDLSVETTENLNSDIACAGALEITGTLNTMGNNLTVTGDITGTGGTLASTTGGTIDSNGAITVETVTSTGNTLYFAGDDFNPGTAFTAGTGTVTLDGATAATIGSYTYNNLTINKGGNADCAGGITVSGALTMTAGNWTLGAYSHSIAGNWDSTGITLDATGSTVTLTGGGTITHTAAEGFNHLTVDADYTLGSALEAGGNLQITAGNTLTDTGSAAISVGGNWDNDGNFDALNGTVTLTGAGFISGMSGANDFYNLTVSGGARTTSDAMDVANITDISGGSLNTAGDTVTTGTLTVSGGTLTNGAGSSWTVDAAGGMTVSSGVYAGGGTMTVNPGGLAISGTGDFTASGSVDVTTGNLTVSSTGSMTPSGIITIGGTSTFTGGTFVPSNTFTSTGLVTVNGGTAVLTNNGLLNGNNGLTLTNGTHNGAGNIDITGAVTLNGGGLVGTGRTINVNGDWTETVGGFTDTSGTVVIDGACTLRTVNSFFNLTVSADTSLFNGLTVDNTLAQTGTATLTAPSGQSITVTADLDLTGTAGGISFTAAGALNVGTTTDLTGGTAITLGTGNDVFNGNVTNGGTITAGSGTVTFAAEYSGAAGTLTGNAGVDPRWYFDGNAIFGTVNMDGDDVEFTNAVASHDCTPGAAGLGFDLIIIPDNVTLNLLGGGTLRANALQIGTAASAPGDYDNGAVFDANSVNFVIGTVDNGGVFSLTGNQTNPNQDITVANGFDSDSGWLEYDGGAATLDNPDYNDVWNLRIQSGNYTLGQDLIINGNGPDRDTDTIAYNDEGLLLDGGTLNGGAGGYVITLYEMFSTSGGGAFVSGDSHVLITGAGDGFIDAPAAGTITFYQLTCNYVAFDFAPPAIAADLSVSAKNLYFNPDTTTAVTGYLALSGNQTTAPNMNPAPLYDDAGSTYLQLMPTSDPASPAGPIAANEYWRLDVQPGAQIFMENLAAWYSDGTSNPFVTQTRVDTYLCIGWLDYVEILNSQTLDSDDDGKIDRVLITVGVGLLQGAAAYSGFEADVSGYTVTGYSDGAVTDEFYIELQENSSLDTDATPTLQIIENTTLLDSATSTKLVIVPPYTVDNSSTQVIADTAEPVIGYTLAVPENNQVFVHFSEPVEAFGGGAITLADFNLTGFSQAATGLTPVTTSGFGTEEVLIDFAGDLTMADCLDATLSMQVASQFRDMAATPNLMDNSLARNTAHSATDILIGPTNNGPVEPLWAIDRTRASGSASGAGTGVINEFDGSGHLKDEDINLQTHLSADIPAASLASDIELRFVQDPGYANSNNLWMDDAYYTESDWSGLVPYLTANGSINSVTGTMNAVNNQVWDFAINGGNISNNKDLHFLFYLDIAASTNRYAGRISDHTASNWYRLVYPWSFGVHDIVDQGAGVSILNNIINPQQGESTTLYYDLSKGGMVSVQVFDLAGGLVEILHRGRQEAGEYSLVWNGTNRSGNYVARGIYFVRLVGPGVDEMRKVMVIK